MWPHSHSHGESPTRSWPQKLNSLLSQPRVLLPLSHRQRASCATSVVCRRLGLIFSYLLGDCAFVIPCRNPNSVPTAPEAALSEAASDLLAAKSRGFGSSYYFFSRPPSAADFLLFPETLPFLSPTVHLGAFLSTLWHCTPPIFPGFSACHLLNGSVPGVLSQAPSTLTPHSLLTNHPLPRSLRNLSMGLRPLSSPDPSGALPPHGLLPTGHALVAPTPQSQGCSSSRVAHLRGALLSGSQSSSRNHADITTLYLPLHTGQLTPCLVSVPGKCLFGLLLLSIFSGATMVHRPHHLSPGLLMGWFLASLPPASPSSTGSWSSF